jgi:hypothetical protein
MRMMGAESVEYHRATVLGRVDDHPGRAMEYYVVVMRHVAGLREADIAEALGMSRSTVSSTLRSAHDHLGHAIEEGP